MPPIIFLMLVTDSPSPPPDDYCVDFSYVLYKHIQPPPPVTGPQMGLVSFVNRNRPELTAVTFKTENER